MTICFMYFPSFIIYHIYLCFLSAGFSSFLVFILVGFILSLLPSLILPFLPAREADAHDAGCGHNIHSIG